MEPEHVGMFTTTFTSLSLSSSDRGVHGNVFVFYLNIHIYERIVLDFKLSQVILQQVRT